MKHSIAETEIEGYRAYRLESADAQVTATFVPGAGMVGASSDSTRFGESHGLLSR